jgi:hypothetical protein
MECRADVREGMVVVSADRQELGRIVRCDEIGFTVEKGKLLHQDLEVRYEDVARIAGQQILLTRRRHDYVEAGDGEPIVTEDELAEVARGELSPEQLEKTVRKVS